jgi:hypothetical protein
LGITTIVEGKLFLPSVKIYDIFYLDVGADIQVLTPIPFYQG